MASVASAYLFGGFRLEPAQRRLLHEGSPVDLPPKAFDALVLLVENAGGLVGKEAFHAALWPRAVVSDVNLNKAIWQIRRALGDEHGPGAYVETVSKQGYRFIAAVQSADNAMAIPPAALVASERPSGSDASDRPPARRVSSRLLLRGAALVAVAVIAYGPLKDLIGSRSGTMLTPQGAISTAAAAQGSVVLAPIARQGNVPAETALQLEQMLALELPISEALRVVPSQPRVPPASGALLQSAAARELAGAKNAAWVVSGVLNATAGEQRIEAEFVVFDRDGRALGSTRVYGDGPELAKLAADLGDRLRVLIGVAPLNGNLAALRTQVLPRDAAVLEGYVQGRDAVSRRDAPAAVMALEPVVAKEPDFAPAHLALARAYYLTGRGGRAVELARGVLKSSASLPRELRLYAEGQLAEFDGRPAQALESYSALHRFFPEQVDYAMATSRMQLVAGKQVEAQSTVDELLRIAPNDARAQFALVQVKDYAGDREATLRAAERCFELAAGAGWQTMQADALRYQARVLTLLDRVDEALGVLNRARTILESSGNRSGLADLDTLLAANAQRRDKPDEAVASLQRALDTYTQLGAKNEAGFAFSDLAEVQARRGDRVAERSAIDAALQLARERGLSALEGRVLHQLANAQLRDGEIGASIATGQALVALRERREDQVALAAAFIGLGNSLYHAGRTAEARENADRALHVAEQTKNHELEHDGHMLRGLIAQVDGDLPSAASEDEAALRAAEQGKDAGAIAEARRELARVAVDRGDITMAAQLLDQADRDLPARADRRVGDWTEGLHVRLLIEQGKLTEARAKLALLREGLDRDRDASRALPLDLIEADLLLREQRPADADALLAKSLIAADKLGFGLFVREAKKKRAAITGG